MAKVTRSEVEGRARKYLTRSRHIANGHVEKIVTDEEFERLVRREVTLTITQMRMVGTAVQDD
jgi:hypothetical protein